MKEFSTPNGKLVVEMRQLTPLPLFRHIVTLGDHKWIIDTKKGARLSLFDLVLWKLKEGTYRDLALWVQSVGEEGLLPDTYVYQPMDDVVIALDPIEVIDDQEFVGLYIRIADIEYFVSVTPHTPVGLLGRTALYLRKKQGDWR